MNGFNRHGRAISESMRLRDFKRFVAKQAAPEAYIEQYRDFGIRQHSDRSGWTITYPNGHIWPDTFTSLAKARAQVDAYYELRQLLSGT